MEYKFVWILENYSYCWLQNGEPLNSPAFTTGGLEGTGWTLKLFPRGYTDEETGFISLFLCRNADGGPEYFTLKYELSMFTLDKVVIYTDECEYTFKTGNRHGYRRFALLDDVLVRRKSVYLPHDTLRLCCKIRVGEGPFQTFGRSLARSRIAIKKISFLHLVEGFSTLELNQSQTLKLESGLEKECILTSRVFCTEDSSEEKIMIEITSSILQFLIKCKISLLDASRNITEFGTPDNISDVLVMDGIFTLSLSLTKRAIMDRQSEYLMDDTLSLLFECIFSTGLEYQKIEETVLEMPTMAAKIISNFEAPESLPASFNAVDDFKSLYCEQYLTDVEIKTKTASFSAHKIVLWARSPVLGEMLKNDMRDENCIEIEDMEDEILNQFLVFLYCDKVEGLQWETATKLYHAAYKYGVEKLKFVCSQFLDDNLSKGTVVELLLLADTCNDSGLKRAAEDFIFYHDVPIFCSDEWDSLIQTNPLLAGKTMQLIYKRQKLSK